MKSVVALDAVAVNDVAVWAVAFSTLSKLNVFASCSCSCYFASGAVDNVTIGTVLLL